MKPSFVTWRSHEENKILIVVKSFNADMSSKVWLKPNSPSSLGIKVRALVTLSACLDGRDVRSTNRETGVHAHVACA